MVRLKNQAGFGIIQVIIGFALTALLAYSVITLQSNQSKGNRLLASQNSTTGLAAAIRTQLARRESCVPSFVAPPVDYVNGSEVSVRLGPDAGSTVVQAGAELGQWKVRVASLRVANLAAFGTANNGNTVYLGDVLLRTESSQLNPGQRMTFKELTVSRLTFELKGSQLMACYAGDSYSDTTQQLEQVCGMTTSPDGAPGVWQNGKCVVMDAYPQTTCHAQGGTWDGSTCIPNQAKTCASQGGSWDGAICTPAPSQTCQKLGGQWTGSSCSFRKDTVTAGCVCGPGENILMSCPNPWICWGGANPGGSCPAGYDRRDTGYVSGGPTGFICVGQ